eukprot:CAMPEP_0116126326 /NCGR_PEP_ID=MMETSP0329-20121206/6276_1 /TAXON_ID=697910 /ORGANISM="Pseudo-nitzschia arenysensis, Strain B593" /LENGTH=897 /DNA_ID=CAMNT_0003620409 /DNA_START=112 /DNA_END=2805 /DNA_ORIENTATION=-
MSLWSALIVTLATIGLAKGESSFPVIYTAHYKNISTANAIFLQRFDLIEIECDEENTVDSTQKESSNDESHDLQSCRGHLLVRSHEEYQEIIASQTRVNSETQDEQSKTTILNASSNQSTLQSFEYNSTLTKEWVHHRMKVAEGDSSKENRQLHDSANKKRRKTAEDFRNRNDYLFRNKEYSTILFYDCYYDYAGTMEWIRDFFNTYTTESSPLEVTWTDIGDSWKKTKNDGGYDIFALTITLKSKDNPTMEIPTSLTSPSQRSAGDTKMDKAPILLVSSTHAREYTPPILVRRWLEYLSQKVEEKDPTYLSMLEHTKIHWIPYLNPDGRQLAENLQPFRRKNLNDEWTGIPGASAICAPDNFGVDLNRNCPFEWGKNDGSSSQACSPHGRGAYPGSEPETQALTSYASQIFPVAQRRENALNSGGGDYFVAHDYEESVEYSSTKWIGFTPDTTRGVFIDVHSYGKVYIYPWGNVNSVSPNDLSFRSGMGHVETLTRLDALGPGPEHYGVASGATDDWAYAVLGAFAMTWELGSRFHEPCDDFEERYERHLGAFLYLAQIAPFPFAMGRGPVVAHTQVPHETIRLHYQVVEEEVEGIWIFDLDDNSTDVNDNNTDVDELESYYTTTREIVRMESNTVFDLGESIDLLVAIKFPEVIKGESATINFDGNIQGHYENTEDEASSVEKIRIFYGEDNPLTVAPSASSTFEDNSSSSAIAKHWEMNVTEGIDTSDGTVFYTVSITRDQLWEAFGDKDEAEYTTEQFLYIQAMDNLGNPGPIDAVRLTIMVVEAPELDGDGDNGGDSGLSLGNVRNTPISITLPPTSAPAPQTQPVPPPLVQEEKNSQQDNPLSIVDAYAKNIADEPENEANGLQELSSGWMVSGIGTSSLLSTLLFMLLDV